MVGVIGGGRSSLILPWRWSFTQRSDLHSMSESGRFIPYRQSFIQSTRMIPRLRHHFHNLYLLDGLYSCTSVALSSLSMVAWGRTPLAVNIKNGRGKRLLLRTSPNPSNADPPVTAIHEASEEDGG